MAFLDSQRRRCRAMLVSSMLFVCTFTVCAASAFAANEPLSMREVAPGVFVHFGVNALMSAANLGAIANVGFIVGDQAVAVIDTGGSVIEGRQLRAAVKEATAKPIRYVINTHAHPDHMFGNAAFDEDAPLFVGHRNFLNALAARGPHYLTAFRDIMGDTLDGVRLIKPSVLVADTLELDLGNRVLALRAWSVAHSDTDLSIFDNATQTLFSGDLVFRQHIPVVDGSISGWLRVEEMIAAIPAQRVVPGHGPVSDWPSALEEQRRYLEQLAQDSRALIKQGVGLAKAATIAGQKEKPFWEMFEAYNSRNATAAFAELEWE
jgi:quinoprotein relay system zinc metallohydrolase 2